MICFSIRIDRYVNSAKNCLTMSNVTLPPPPVMTELHLILGVYLTLATRKLQYVKQYMRTLPDPLVWGSCFVFYVLLLSFYGFIVQVSLILTDKFEFPFCLCLTSWKISWKISSFHLQTLYVIFHIEQSSLFCENCILHHNIF